MKFYLKFILICFFLISCSEENTSDDKSEILITVKEITEKGATISWTKPSGFSSVVSYRILINNQVVAENIRSHSLLLENYEADKTYEGTIFALDNEGNETFSGFSFTTLKPTSIRAITITTQEEIDNFSYTSVGTLIINGRGITNLKGLSSLKKVSFQVKIEGTNIDNLEGLENIVEGNNYEHLWPQLIVESNHKLKDVSASQTFVNKCVKVSFLNNSSLTDFKNLKIPEKSNLVLGFLPLVNLQSIVFPKELRSLIIWRMPNLVDFSGLENLKSLYNGGSPFKKEVSFKWNPKLESLKGLNNFEGVITAGNNESLVDFCALKNPKKSLLEDNLYNPTNQEFDEGKCKL